jgi:Immunoglobulin I-set domain/Domain of unknown function (DUF5122) beta-propeller
MKISIGKLTLKTKSLFFCTAALCLMSGRLWAGGEVDNSFHPPSFDEPIFAVAVDSHTNIWVGGGFATVGGETHNSLVLLNPDGSLNPDYTFNFDTVAFGYVVSLAVDDQDDVYVGYRSYGGGAGVARFNAPAVAGNPWQYDEYYSTNISTKINAVNSIALGTNRDLFVAGGVTSGGTSYPLGHFDSAGNLDYVRNFPTLGTAFTIYQVTYRAAGAASINGGVFDWPESLLLAGTFGAAEAFSDGSVGPVYAPLNGQLFSCAAERDNFDELSCPSPYGEMLGGGWLEPYQGEGTGFNYGSMSGMILERLGASESTNYFPPISKAQNYPADNGSFISRIIAMPDGDMLVAGQFSSIRGHGVGNFAHLLPDGSVDPNFLNQSSSVYGVLDMARQPDGKYLLAGAGEYTGPNGGAIERRNALPASGVSFNSQPQPASQTVYEGDSASFSADASSWPGLSAQWIHAGTNLTDQTSTSLYLNNVTTNDSGQYALSVQNDAFCPASAVSSDATLTVLPAPPAPPNDLFANAILLDGFSVTGSGTLRSATLDSGETDHDGFYDGHSVWWTWTAPFTGQAYVDVSHCDFPAIIGIFTGNDASDLTVVTNNYDFPLYCECSDMLTNFNFNVIAGTTYRIAIGGAPNAGSLGNILFSIGQYSASWTQNTSATSDELHGVTVGGHRIVAVGNNNAIVTSTDGTNWSTGTVSAASSELVGATYANGMFVTTGDGGTILTSGDGTNWTQQASGVSDGLWGVTFGNGTFVAAGDNGTIVSSLDGVNWTEQTNSAADWFNSVTFNHGQFVAVGGYGEFCTSPDGTNWTHQASPVGDYLYGVTSGKGQFVAVGDNADVVTSPDGTNWTWQDSGAGYVTLYGVAFGNGHFVAVGNNGTLLLSTDGTNWISDATGVNDTLEAVSYYENGSFVIVGDNGIILFNQPPRLSVLPLTSNHTLQFNLNGLNGSTTIIEATPTLSPAAWQPIATNVINHGVVTFTDVMTSHAFYYRARIQ